MRDLSHTDVAEAAMQDSPCWKNSSQIR